MRVAIAERDRLGGECNYYGCVPTKVMLRSAKIAALARDAGRFGVRIPSVVVDLPAVQQRARDVIDAQSGEGAAPFERAGIRVFMQEAQSDRPPSDRARGRHAGRGRPGRAHHRNRSHRPADRRAEGRAVLDEQGSDLGTDGAAPLARGHRRRSDRRRVRADLLTVRDAGHGPGGAPPYPPRRGRGGRRRARARVRGGRRLAPCGRDDRTRAPRIRMDGRSSSRGDEPVRADELLVATGRRPVFDGHDLEAAGVELDDRGRPILSETLRTTGSDVWAAGDATGELLFTHVGGYEAEIVVDDILGQPRPRDYRVVPKVTFCDPEVASVGLTEREAREQGHEVQTAVSSLADNERAHIEGSAHGAGEARSRRANGRAAGRAHRRRRGGRDDPRDRRRDGRASLGVQRRRRDPRVPHALRVGEGER